MPVQASFKMFSITLVSNVYGLTDNFLPVVADFLCSL